ncbi:MAG: DUF2277 domain-containing protein [Candidatus Shapirobacteria bacterium]|jgi:hypothetical protein
MCRSIKPLFNFDPPATTDEINHASQQFVKKISGLSKPSKINVEVFDKAVLEISKISQELLETLVTNAKPKNREKESQKAKEKSLKRFGISSA